MQFAQPRRNAALFCMYFLNCFTYMLITEAPYKGERRHKKRVIHALVVYMGGHRYATRSFPALCPTASLILSYQGPMLVFVSASANDSHPAMAPRHP